MGFWQLDEKTQLALLMAGLAGAGLAGCDDRPTTVDPVPGDFRVDKPQVVDPAPNDFRVDKPQVVDPPPRDFRVDQPMVVDMVPPDMKVDTKKKIDFPPPVDPLPVDASAANPSRPGLPPAPQPQGRERLPINRDLRTVIKARRLADGRLELRAVSSGAAAIRHGWIASAGSLDRSDGEVVIWTPPATRGLHMVQVTARDGSRAISVDVMLHETY
jgi:hypothetical protein